MNSLTFVLQSALRSTLISLQRSFDHTYRRIVGVPTLRFSEITPQLYLGGQYSSRGFGILRRRGITAIVSMRTQARKNLPDLGEVRFLHLPTPDLHPPVLSDLEKGAEFIAQELSRGGKVYVHCHYGEGRGPSMIAAYLMYTGLTFEDALKQIRSVRGFIGLTQPQVDRLLEFEKEIQERKSPAA